jgi:hypothetical protein
MALWGRPDSSHGRSCVVSDLCPAMLDVARRRAGPFAADMQFRLFDAHHLTEVASGYVGLYSMSLGMKTAIATAPRLSRRAAILPRDRRARLYRRRP